MYTVAPYIYASQARPMPEVGAGPPKKSSPSSLSLLVLLQQLPGQFWQVRERRDLGAAGAEIPEIIYNTAL